jgi:hypothetical protein
MDFSASAATKDAARLRRRRFCTPPRFYSTLPQWSALAGREPVRRAGSDPVDVMRPRRC